ncbi:uncharacterized protein BX664DRAFT_300423 [Halteromyces radiatus]|uniref:uncharacterized protein n=1 Tax=Halteromyces radiatus TaxID=101107 RepID=UPI002220F4AE|nr:uncharacterized protein BX664DRAFT_300423 [Halteromyces radiatus]KAI8084866.1 hypothetical protein BX664DRAFT_300423 [Halteromyces radiatus]
MGDALCMVMVPPTSHESHGQESNVGTPNTTTTATTGSSFRRSLNLSHGAFGLRRFSRSISHEPSETPVTENNSRRRSTISTMTAQANNTLHVRIVPSIENPSRSLIFDIFERELQPAVYIKIGRFTDRSQSPTHMSFKSKVVSRSHCEIWMEDGKLFVRDTKSSSGTFVNHIRISPPNQESRPYEIKDGDIVQLGVDYQGGVEEIYRSVKMRFEVNRTRRQRPLSFNMTAFQNIRNLTDSNYEACQGMDQVEECCICLYALAPYQALFVSPCAHTYHYKCIRPLLQSYPGFQCPICRTYSDLDANINMESHEVIEKYGLRRQSTIIDPTATMSCVTTTNDTQQQSEQNISQQLPTITDQQISNTSASSAPQPINESYNVDDDMAPLANLTTMDYQNLSTNHHSNASGFVEKLKMAFFEKRKSSIIVAPRERKRTNRPRPLSYPNFLRPSHIDDSHTDDDDSDDDDDDVLQRSDISNASSSSPASPTITHLLQQHQQHQQHQHQQQQQQQQQNNSTSMASTANHSLSRQSTAHLAEIEEEDEVPWHQHFNQYQPMSVDG